MDKVLKSVLLRFVRAFVAGAVATMITITPLSINNWTDVSTWLGALGLSGIIGGVSGLLMAIDKYLRSE